MWHCTPFQCDTLQWMEGGHRGLPDLAVRHAVAEAIPRTGPAPTRPQNTEELLARENRPRMLPATLTLAVRMLILYMSWPFKNDVMA